MVVAGALWKFPFTAIRTLHLDVVDAAIFIMYVDIQSDAFTVIAIFDGFFTLRKCNLLDSDAQDFLDQLLADASILHDLLKEEIVLDGEFFPLFESSHGTTAFLLVL